MCFIGEIFTFFLHVGRALTDTDKAWVETVPVRTDLAWPVRIFFCYGDDICPCITMMLFPSQHGTPPCAETPPSQWMPSGDMSPWATPSHQNLPEVPLVRHRFLFSLGMSSQNFTRRHPTGWRSNSALSHMELSFLCCYRHREGRVSSGEAPVKMAEKVRCSTCQSPTLNKHCLRSTNPYIFDAMPLLSEQTCNDPNCSIFQWSMRVRVQGKFYAFA